MYLGLFDSWSDVVKEFFDCSYDDEKLAKLLPTMPEPEVVVAVYEYESYNGDAFICYRENGKYYTVTGCHCSCYGLEDQWNPEEYAPELFRELVDRQLANDSHYGVEKQADVWPKIDAWMYERGQ